MDPRAKLTDLAVKAASRPGRLGDDVRVAGLTCRYSDAELGRRLRRIDLVAADVDECIFPGFSQTYLGYLTFLYITTDPQQAADLGLIPQLLRGGMYIRKVSLLHRLHRTPSNAALMERYERSMLGVPRAYFERGARTIPGRSFARAVDTLSLLGRRVVVGTVSFGIHPIAEAYTAELARINPGCHTFAEANTIRFEADDRGRQRFAGYRRPLRTDPAEKGDILRARLDRHGASVPLVFGNGRDEATMAELARERGGLSVGINPMPEEDELFDLVLHGPDWTPVFDLLRRHFAQRGSA